jgi:hypothetical protein
MSCCAAQSSRGPLPAGHTGNECTATSSRCTNRRASGRQKISDRSNPDTRITVGATFVAIAVVCADSVAWSMSGAPIYIEDYIPLYYHAGPPRKRRIEMAASSVAEVVTARCLRKRSTRLAPWRQKSGVMAATRGLATTRRFSLEACSACRWRRGPSAGSRSSRDEKRPRPRRPRARDPHP